LYTVPSEKTREVVLEDMVYKSFINPYKCVGNQAIPVSCKNIKIKHRSAGKTECREVQKQEVIKTKQEVTKTEKTRSYKKHA
jgi:hypothetical protein